MKKYQIGILGLGRMGSAILQGITKSKQFEKDEILLYDAALSINERLKNEHYHIALNEQDIFQNVQTIIIAIKPQMFKSLESKVQNIDNELLIISIAPGINIDSLKQLFPNQKYVRVMPNTPALIMQATSAIAYDKNISKEEKELVKTIFASIGEVVEIREELFDEVIPLNGSMPAFLYYFALAFIEKAVSDGFTYQQAKQLVASAIIGSAQMILTQEKTIEQLISDVCSPKGTTLAGLDVLKNSVFHELIKETSTKCIARAKELAIEQKEKEEQK